MATLSIFPITQNSERHQGIRSHTGRPGSSGQSPPNRGALCTLQWYPLTQHSQPPTRPRAPLRACTHQHKQEREEGGKRREGGEGGGKRKGEVRGHHQAQNCTQEYFGHNSVIPRSFEANKVAGDSWRGDLRAAPKPAPEYHPCTSGHPHTLFPPTHPHHLPHTPTTTQAAQRGWPRQRPARAHGGRRGSGGEEEKGGEGGRAAPARALVRGCTTCMQQQQCPAVTFPDPLCSCCTQQPCASADTLVKLRMLPSLIFRQDMKESPLAWAWAWDDPNCNHDHHSHTCAERPCNPLCIPEPPDPCACLGPTSVHSGQEVLQSAAT